MPAVAAASKVTDKFVVLFQNMDKEYMRERAQDIQDIGGRLLDALQGIERQELSGVEGGTVLIAHDITPSDAMDIDPEYVFGFVTRIGGKTSHTAILARSMGIPAIVGAGASVEQITNGARIIVDGGSGICIVNPSEQTTQSYLEKKGPGCLKRGVILRCSSIVRRKPRMVNNSSSLPTSALFKSLHQL